MTSTAKPRLKIQLLASCISVSVSWARTQTLLLPAPADTYAERSTTSVQPVSSLCGMDEKPWNDGGQSCNIV